MPSFDPDELLAEIDSEATAPTAPAQKSGGLDFLLKAAGLMSDVGGYMNPASPQSLQMGADAGKRWNSATQNAIGGAVDKAGQVSPMLGDWAAAHGTIAGTAAEYAIPQNRLGVLGAGLAASNIGSAVDDLATAAPIATSSRPGGFANLGYGRTKVPPGDLQQAMRDPSVWSAAPVDEANAAYAAAAPGKGVTASLGQKLKKTIISEDDYTQAINRTGRILRGEELDEAGKVVSMDPQTALEGVQSINRYLRNKAFTSRLDGAQKMEIGQLKDELMDWMTSNGAPALRGAAAALRKSHVKENLSRMLPQNKFGGPDALRTWGAGGELAGAIGLAAAGHPLIAAPIAMEAASASPYVWGGAIRNAQALAAPLWKSAAGSLAAGSSGFDSEMGPQRGR